MRYCWLWLALVLLFAGPAGCTQAFFFSQSLFRRGELERLNRRLEGQIVDHTANHGVNRRFYSEALQSCRDLYVYLPPGYNASRQYPVMFWMHAFTSDECDFLKTVAPQFDAAIAKGCMKPLIIVSIDGTVDGRCQPIPKASFFSNSQLGRYEDYVMDDVWQFIHRRYPIDPDRNQHVLAGASMGGGAAFRMGMRNRDRVGHVMGIYPPLNLRYKDCRGGLLGNFNPNCMELRDDFSRQHLPVARYFGFIPIPIKILLNPLVSRQNSLAIDYVSSENPYELLDTLDIKPNDLGMFAAYGTLDQFNMDAQVESFAYRARQRGLEMTVIKQKGGRHDGRAAISFVPDMIAWLNQRLTDSKSP
ncbi:MAG: hypothetical protein EBS30_13200 [Planctomycetes bacterium]|nr:hypothetical protein [Planctomycetota bacterium]